MSNLNLLYALCPLKTNRKSKVKSGMIGTQKSHSQFTPQLADLEE